METHLKTAKSQQSGRHYQSPFVDYFNPLYAKPRLRKNPDRYVAHAWNWESWFTTYAEKHDKHGLTCVGGVCQPDGTLTCMIWKGLPLTVHCNPYTEVMKVELKG